MRTDIFGTGAVILVFGLIIVMNYQPLISAAESIVGGWAMLSKDYQQWRAYLSIGQIMVVVGIIIMIPGIILKTKKTETF